MKVCWVPGAWEDYLYWQSNDIKIVTRINNLIEASRRTPFEGIGKPEGLKHNMKGCWSRRINDEHRLVYKVDGDMLVILQCRYHY